MGSCFRPTRVDPATGKRVRYKRYRLIWTDELGRRQSAMAYGDHAASRAMLERKEREAARRKEGLPVADQSKLLMPAGELVERYMAELVSRGSDPRGEYVRQTRLTLLRVFKGCGWASLGDVRRDGLSTYLASLAAEGRAAGTRYLAGQLTRGLVRWAFDQHWLAEDPLAGMRLPRTGKAHRRRRRRAFTRPELFALLESAPPRRSLLYRLAALTGYRRKELGLIERRDAALDGDRPRWQLRAECAKNRRLDVVPVCPDALGVARAVWETLPLPTSRAVSSPLLCGGVPKCSTFDADLARAGIAKVDAEGRRADFHSLRYTFGRLMAQVLPIQAVKVLMRHASIKLTADLYGELGLEEAGEMVWTLPSVLGG